METDPRSEESPLLHGRRTCKSGDLQAACRGDGRVLKAFTATGVSGWLKGQAETKTLEPKTVSSSFVPRASSSILTFWEIQTRYSGAHNWENIKM